ncbi:YbaK/EbsC family protein [Arthrobacter castelli]|uniref:YbaK/EbsC family protein n=1 Tax=Arthrobacter castelli TaxID=271431 RepID=UPI0004167D8F|nr:YbaK/EbsC family protein [Arthrobacter castelli]
MSHAEEAVDAAGHPNVRKVVAALEAAGHPTTVTVLPERAHTAALAAEAQGVEVGAIANSLVFTLDGEPVLIMTSGVHRVDTALVGRELGGRLKQASADVVRASTGQPIGGVAPLGHPSPVRTFVDRALEQYPRIWAAAGHPNTVFDTNYQQLLRLTGGRAIEVC